MVWINIAWVVAVGINLVQMIYGDGEISLKFVRYVNPGGKGANNHCCDGRAFFCEIRGCDHYFRVCIDNFYGNNDLSQCAYGDVTTGVTKDKDSIWFSSSIGGTSNPILFSFSQIQEPGIRLKVRIADEDSVNDDDYVETLYSRFAAEPARSKEQATYSSVELKGRTTLTLEVSIYCNENWYGGDCGTFCQSRDNEQGHYNCNIRNGRKECRAGWTGSSCTKPINECESSPCLNGGECIDKHRSFLCRCQTGFRGSRCQLDINECNSNNPCHDGRCVNTAGSFHCDCFLGYTGRLCDEEVDYCVQEPCQNHGECQNVFGGYFCNCSEGYHGLHCEELLPKDSCYPGACDNTSFCVALSPFAFECRPLNVTSPEEISADRLCPNITTMGINKISENATQSVALQRYLSQALPFFLPDGTKNQTKDANYSYMKNITSTFDDLLGLSCDCYACDNGQEITFSNLLLPENSTSNSSYMATGLDIHNRSFTCGCDMFFEKLVENDKKICNINDSDAICKCPGSGDCEPYSERCPSTTCARHKSCFPVYVRMQTSNVSLFATTTEPITKATAISWINQNGTENLGKNINETMNSDNSANKTVTILEECLCMELNKEKQLMFCTAEDTVLMNCPSEYCANGGTCIEGADDTLPLNKTSFSKLTSPKTVHTIAKEFTSADSQTVKSIFQDGHAEDGVELTTSVPMPSSSDALRSSSIEVSTFTFPTTSAEPQQPNSFHCLCPSDYTGIQCESNIDHDVCLNIICQNNGTCLPRVDSFTNGTNNDSNNIGQEYDYMCACQDGYSGSNCEQEEHTGQTDQKTKDEIKSEDASSAFMFKGKLNEKDIHKIKAAIMVILKKSSYSDDAIQLSYNLGSCTNDETDHITVFVFDVTVNSKLLNHDIVDDIFGDLAESNFEHLFPVPFYTGEQCNDVNFAYMKQEKQNWFLVNWYILVLPSLVFVAGVIIIVALHRRRRKLKITLHNNNALVTHDDGISTSQNDITNGTALAILDLQQADAHSYGSNNAIHPMCFHNDLYDDVHNTQHDYDYLQFPPREVQSQK